MSQPWCVLFFDRALQRTDAVWHEYASPGRTACGRTFYLTQLNYSRDLDAQHGFWVNRKNAEKFSRACGHCQNWLTKSVQSGNQ